MLPNLKIRMVLIGSSPPKIDLHCGLPGQTEGREKTRPIGGAEASCAQQVTMQRGGDARLLAR